MKTRRLQLTLETIRDLDLRDVNGGFDVLSLIRPQLELRAARQNLAAAKAEQAKVMTLNCSK